MVEKGPPLIANVRNMAIKPRAAMMQATCQLGPTASPCAHGRLNRDRRGSLRAGLRSETTRRLAYVSFAETALPPKQAAIIARKRQESVGRPIHWYLLSQNKPGP